MGKKLQAFLKYFCIGLLILLSHEFVTGFLYLRIIFYILVFIFLIHLSVYEGDKKYKIRIIVSALLICSGLPFFDYCGTNHMCSGGHMAHPPYEIWDYVSEILYSTLLLAGGVFLYKVKNRFCTFTAILVHFSLFFRVLRVGGI